MKDLITDIKSFNEFGTSTAIEYVGNVPYFINEYWTSKQRQCNKIHEVSYRACFKPQLPAFFIDRLTTAGDIVYDPFMGRGTTPVETALYDRIPYGNDVNPLSKIFVEPRINPPSIVEIEDRLKEIQWNTFNSITDQELLTFYHKDTLTKLEGLKQYIIDKRNNNQLDIIDKWISMVAVNRLTGHSPGFFSVYTLPPNQAVSIERQKKINESRKQEPVARNIPELILKKSKALLSDPIKPRMTRSNFSTGMADDTSHIKDDEIALTVTSPPFLDVVDYKSDNWLRCWFMGIDLDTVDISTCNKIEDWEQFIRKTLVELERITKPQGYVAFEVGEVRNGKIKLDEHVIKMVDGLAFKVLGVMINSQSFTKTSNCWNVTNNNSGTNTNRIVILQKET